MELPKYIQLDFLFVVLGIIFFGFTNYLFLISEKQLSVGIVLYLTFLGVVGVFLFGFGIWEMMRNYNRDNKLQNLRVKKEEITLKNDLNKVKK